MKDFCFFVCQAALVLSLSFLVESESQIRHCETLPEINEHWQEHDCDPVVIRDLKEWRSQRTKTLSTLRDLRDKLDTLCVSANYGKGAGNGVQIMGSVASIVGSFMELAGLPSFKSIMGIGDLVYHSGSMMDGVSSIVESFGSSKYLNDVDQVLNEDKKSSDSLGNRLKVWKSLDKKIYEIFGFDITSQKWIQFESFLHEFVRVRAFTKNIDKTIDHLKSGKYSTYIETQMRSDKLLKLSHYFEKNPQIPAEIRMGLVGVNRISSLVKSFKKFVGKEISEKYETLPEEYKKPTVDTVAEYAFLRSIDVAVNFMSLLDVAKVIEEGKSKYSDPLNKIIDMLELELKNMGAF